MSSSGVPTPDLMARGPDAACIMSQTAVPLNSLPNNRFGLKPIPLRLLLHKSLGWV